MSVDDDDRLIEGGRRSLDPGGPRVRRRAAAHVARRVRRAGPREGTARAAARRRARARRARRPPAVQRASRARARPRSPRSSRTRWGPGSSRPRGPALERPSDLAAILTNLGEGDVLFVDEIHRMPRPVEEVLYPALEDFTLDVVLGKGPTARSIRLDLPRFTLVGATTRPGRITLPLRERFGFSPRLDYYAVEDLARSCCERPGSSRSSPTPTGAARDRPALARDAADREPAPPPRARRRRGPPRRRDHRRHRAGRARGVRGRRAGPRPARPRRAARRSWSKFGGGPVGLTTLAAAVGEEPDTVEDVVEPYLLQLGFLQRTPRGRVATERAYRHLGRAGRRAPCRL